MYCSWYGLLPCPMRALAYFKIDAGHNGALCTWNSNLHQLGASSATGNILGSGMWFRAPRCVETWVFKSKDTQGTQDSSARAPTYRSSSHRRLRASARALWVKRPRTSTSLVHVSIVSCMYPQYAALPTVRPAYRHVLSRRLTGHCTFILSDEYPLPPHPHILPSVVCTPP